MFLRSCHCRYHAVDKSFVGKDDLIYEVCGQHDNCDTATVFIEVQPNIIPKDDFVSTSQVSCSLLQLGCFW